VVANAVRHSLNEHALLALNGAAACLARGGENSESIITIDTDSVKTISGTAGRDTVAGVLVNDGGGDGEAVVAAEPHERATKHRVHVECGVEVTLGGGTIAEVADHAVALPALICLERVSCASRLRQLRRERRRDGVETQVRGRVVHWHHATLTAVVVDVAEALAHHA
jgi:hypothetical protein